MTNKRLRRFAAGRVGRAAGVVAVGVTVMAGIALAAVPQASAAGLGNQPVTVFQANTGHLWIGSFDTGLGMAAGTSPSISVLSDNSQEAAFQANTGILWFAGSHGSIDTQLGMAAGTSPCLAATANGQWVAAFQANTGHLWFTGPGIGSIDTQLGMAAGTSPSIATMPDGSYRAAFQANTGHLWVTGPGIGSVDTGLVMAAGTSPSITTVGGGYEVAYQSSSHFLAYYGNSFSGSTSLGMDVGSSPSITTVVADEGGFITLSYQAAFQANTGNLWTDGIFGSRDLDLGMARGTSPSITGIEGVNTGEGAVEVIGYHIAFQANTGTLWNYDDNFDIFSNNSSLTNSNSGLGMNAKSSPGATSTHPLSA